MTANRITAIKVRQRVLNPAEAELWVTVEAEGLSPDAEVRGRLLGPRCRYSTTIEVAYPLRPLPAAVSAGAARTCRVIIPEPSFWDPESPFYYRGPVEVWLGNDKVAETHLRLGLKQVSLSARGLRWNGQPLEVRGANYTELTEEAALRLRSAGKNALLVPVAAATAPVWDAADEFGFVVLGLVPADERVRSLVVDLSGHPSCLGWVLPEEVLAESWPAELAHRLHGTGQLLGCRLTRPATPAELSGVQFVLSDEPLGLEGGSAQLPTILWPTNGNSESAPPPDVLGQVEP
jgi:hypothetical protein